MNEVNNSIYEVYGDRWYTADDDPIALLRAESRAKLPWVVEKIRHKWGMTPVSILDVGCGGGFLSNALALEGFSVTGVDLSAESLKVAQRHDQTQSVQYLPADAYHLPFPDKSFDVITAMDFLEHVEHPERVVKECARILKPGGYFIFHTFNQNFFAWLIIIKFVEWLVKNTPKDMHVLRLFIKPSVLTKYCAENGLAVSAMTGLRPVLSSIKLKNIWTGVVPKEMAFVLTPSTLLSYMGMAEKK